MHNNLKVLAIVIFAFASICRAMESDESSFSQAELEKVLAHFGDLKIVSTHSEDRQAVINSYRKLVLSSLNKGLASIIDPHVSDGAVVELYSTVGYKMSERIERNIVRLQPDEADFYQLQKEGTAHIYPIDIRQFINAVSSHPHKNVSFYLATSFSDMRSKEREEYLSALSMTQKPNDRLTLSLDREPKAEWTEAREAKDMKSQYEGTLKERIDQAIIKAVSIDHLSEPAAAFPNGNLF